MVYPTSPTRSVYTSRCFIITEPIRYCRKLLNKSVETDEILQKRTSDYHTSRTTKEFPLHF